MNIVKVKKIIAKEWLIFLIAIVIGIIISDFAYFTDSNKNLKPWQKDKIISDNPFDQFDERISKTELHNFRQKYPEYNDLDDSTLINKLIAKYREGKDAKIEVDNKSKQKLPDWWVKETAPVEYMDSIEPNKTNKEFDPSTAKPFVEVQQQSKPSFFSGLSKLFRQLFSSLYWFSTLFSILIPYLTFQLFRSIYYSLKILRKK